jgi:hypothetical protein
VKTTDITVTIPVELTAAMIIRAGKIGDEARALVIAKELHEIVARCVELFRAERPDIVERADDDPGKFVTVEKAHERTALEIADFTLACWRQALVSTANQGDDTPDAHEAAWISVYLAGLLDDDLFLRWIMLADVVTGSDCASILVEGGVH